MKNLGFFFLWSVFAFLGCTHNPKLHDTEMFKTKTGVVGVFRQAAFYCSEANPHFIHIGDSTTVVKPTWSDEQDNLFVTELKPGKATLYSYSYKCGANENKFVLDTAAKNAGPSGIIIPENGFCKIVISFLEGDKLFAHNDVLLTELFEKEKVAFGVNNIPYCEVIDNNGSIISFMNKDSLYAEEFKKARAQVADINESKIYPLISIEENSNQVRFNNGKVLMISVSAKANRFNEGILTSEKEVWAFSEKEFLNWYNANNSPKESIRIKQLLGIPASEKSLYFTAFWVDPKDLIRPAFVQDIKESAMKIDFPELDEETENSETMMWFKNWFNDAKKEFLWTKLGYTYDWAAGENHYGMSEFLVVPHAEIDVIFTKNLKGFLNWFEGKK